MGNDLEKLPNDLVWELFKNYQLLRKFRLCLVTPLEWVNQFIPFKDNDSIDKDTIMKLFCKKEFLAGSDENALLCLSGLIDLLIPKGSEEKTKLFKFCNVYFKIARLGRELLDLKTLFQYVSSPSSVSSEQELLTSLKINLSGKFTEKLQNLSLIFNELMSANKELVLIKDLPTQLEYIREIVAELKGKQVSKADCEILEKTAACWTLYNWDSTKWTWY